MKTLPTRLGALILTGLLAPGLLSGCGFLGVGGSEEKTLAQLPPARLPNRDIPVAVVDIDRIEASYQRALAAADNPALQQQIRLRIAELEMTRSEQLQHLAEDAGTFFEKPIALYRQLIELEKANPTPGIAQDQLHYQLAKAYALDGRTDESAQVLDQLAETHPDSPYMAETQFRRAERAFAAGSYREAEQFFQSVVEGDNATLRQNALYMRGWAQFKRGDHELALESFVGVMDQLLAQASQPDQVPGALENLSRASRNLVDDTLRVMALALSNLDGAASIVSLQQQLGPRPYQHLLYDQLGQLYLEQERYTDSAATYQQFVTSNPHSDFAPDFSLRTIQVYEKGNFPSLILPAKKAFVDSYGIRSSFWTQRQGAISSSARAYLHASLQELAKYEHAEAQRLKSEAGAKPGRSQAREISAAYARASLWYREFVQTFPRDPQAPAMTFLLAEALYEAEDLPQALEAYEKVAYEYQDPINGAEAGYAALLITQQLIQGVQPSMGETRNQWQERKILNALRFANHFPGDARAVEVLAQAAPELLQQQRPEEAAQVAERVLGWQPSAPGELIYSSWLVLGHTRFDLGQYQQAEAAYRQVLQLQPGYSQLPGGPSRAEVEERLAASIYRQAEAALAAGNTAEAVDELLRVTQAAPNTEIALKALYDAGHYQLELGQWAAAEASLLSFRQRYPDHPLSASLPAKLVVIHQNRGNWQSAAEELVFLERNAKDPEEKRQALILSAELYEKSGQRNQAIAQYRRYAETYTRPLDEYLEAQYKLTQLLNEVGNSRERQVWLQRLVETDRRAGNARSDRSRYLAASAATELAQTSYQEFVRLPLNLPLRNSLQRKRAALEKALKEQEQIAAYGIAEFTTQASYRMAEIYAQLSRDLMASQRPKELDELELEQYDMLLEEQAYPFEEKAIEIHQVNARRTREGLYDQWVKQSFEALSKLLPARYAKQEKRLEVSREIH
jgi:tetratricopeptide (TPR) repeat protein